MIAAGQSDPLEASWCQRVVDGRLPGYIANTAALPEAAALTQDLPFPIGTHISAPTRTRRLDAGTPAAATVSPPLGRNM